MLHRSRIEAASVWHGYSESRGRVESGEEERELEPEREKRKNQRKILERPVRKRRATSRLPCRGWALEGVAVPEGIALPSERAIFVKRRKEAYEALHPETKYEARPGRAGKSRQVGDNSEPADRFTADTAEKTGQSETSRPATCSAGGGKPQIP